MLDVTHRIHASAQQELFVNLVDKDVFQHKEGSEYTGHRIYLRAWGTDHYLVFHVSVPERIRAALRNRHTKDLTPDFIEEVSGYRNTWEGPSYVFNPMIKPSPDVYKDVVIEGNACNIYINGIPIAFVIPNQASAYAYEIRVWVHEDYRKRGYATQAVRAAVANNLKCMFYSHQASNKASAGVINGLVRTGEAAYMHNIVCFG